MSWTTISTLWACDNVLSEDTITPAQHNTVIDLICRDFEIGPPEALQGVTNSWKSILDDIRDPCLIALVQTNIILDPGGISVFLIRSDDWRKDSWTRIARYLMKHHEGTTSPSVLRYQALLLPFLPHQNELYERTLREPQIMVSDHHAGLLHLPIVTVSFTAHLWVFRTMPSAPPLPLGSSPPPTCSWPTVYAPLQ
jgi:hypothetical protein